MTTPDRLAAQAEPLSELEELRRELHLMKTAGIIEVAVRNPSVSEYMEHWEGRALKAESLATPVPGAVTDEMVERACAAYHDAHPPHTAGLSDRMRAALEAALSAPVAGASGEAREVEPDELARLRHENDCLQRTIAQRDYPCSPHCEGYLREMKLRRDASPHGDKALRDALTASGLADALGCFWNAAIGEAHQRQGYEAMTTASIMAAGFAAVKTRLEELASASLSPSPDKPASEAEVPQLGGAPDDLRNLIKVVFAEKSITEMQAICEEVIRRRDPALAASGASELAELRAENERLREVWNDCEDHNAELRAKNQALKRAEAAEARLAAAPPDTQGMVLALAKGCYIMSEPHLSGYRLIIGFDTLPAVQDAMQAVATAVDASRASLTSTAEQGEK